MKKKTNKIDNYPFIGYDFAELSFAWNLAVLVPTNAEWEYDHDILVIELFLRAVLNNSFLKGGESRVLRKVSKDIRLFASKLSEHDDIRSELWCALSHIDHDMTLLQMTIPLIGYMWS